MFKLSAEDVIRYLEKLVVAYACKKEHRAKTLSTRTTQETTIVNVPDIRDPPKSPKLYAP